jgi:hypothetical protein
MWSMQLTRAVNSPNLAATILSVELYDLSSSLFNLFLPFHPGFRPAHVTVF